LIFYIKKTQLGFADAAKSKKLLTLNSKRRWQVLQTLPSRKAMWLNLSKNLIFNYLTLVAKKISGEILTLLHYFAAF